MGDPKKLKKKYETASHPWNRKAIEEEAVLRKEYGFKNKREIRIAASFLKKYKNIAKKLIATKTGQAEKEKKQVLEKLQKYGILQPGTELANILALELKEILERRIQSITLRNGLAKTPKQARQFIVHRHMMVGDKEITSPSRLLTLEEESKLMFKSNSSLAQEDHPERVVIAKEPPKKEITEKPKEEPLKSPTLKAVE